MSKKIRNLLFLKSTGILIGEITEETDASVMDLTNFYVKSVELDEDQEEFWDGDYHTGSVKSRMDKPVVTESIVKFNTNLKVLEQYPIHKQLNIIIDLLSKSDISKTPEFVEMCEFLKQMREEHAEKVQYYANSKDTYLWVSEKEEQEQIKKKII
jgi:hypothetical protein